MADHENPYRWNNHVVAPDVELHRQPRLDETMRALQRGGGVVLLGGRGLGKSVFLRQLETHLRKKPGVAVFTLDPPVKRSLEGGLAELARLLEVPMTTEPAPPSARELIDQFLERRKDVQVVVLLFDELDQYTIQDKESPGTLGRVWFDHLESARKNTGRLGILAAGGLGVYLLRHVLSSSFLSRASWEKLLPFSEEELHRLAEPFARRGQPLEAEVLEAIRLASGGNPALATYALENLWDTTERTPAKVADIYSRFQVTHHEFVRSALRSLTAEELSGVPAKVLDLVRQAGGAVKRGPLLKTVQQAQGAKLDLKDAFDLLESAGLIRLEGALTDDPVHARLVASLLNLTLESHFQGETETGLIGDLEDLLSLMHSMGVDLLQASKGRELLPEAVYSAFLCMGLRSKGWQAEREAQHGAGRTDIKARRPGRDDLGLIEVKIWGRNDYDGIHHQLCSYWSSHVRVGAAVMLTTSDLPNWGSDYKATCLGGPGLVITEQAVCPPVRAHFIVESRTPDGVTARVHHLLLRIPKR